MMHVRYITEIDYYNTDEWTYWSEDENYYEQWAVVEQWTNSKNLRTVWPTARFRIKREASTIEERIVYEEG